MEPDSGPVHKQLDFTFTLQIINEARVWERIIYECFCISKIKGNGELNTILRQSYKPAHMNSRTRHKMNISSIQVLVTQKPPKQCRIAHPLRLHRMGVPNSDLWRAVPNSKISSMGGGAKMIRKNRFKINERRRRSEEIFCVYKTDMYRDSSWS